ncbi:MAG: hypothetical protein B6I19_09990 [Bacteroidetes bacterium 4572_114]|nr:MAG: hypothetical protein B6I19_09990 [Bacteroidetes bacterium 4572_114]
MFNSTAIEVVIGLVFVYILYSLLVTIVTELISSLINERGRVLKKGLQRMLDDDGEAILSNEFLQRPEIKYLSSKNRLPSYINAPTFSKAMINIFRKANDANNAFGDYMEKLKTEKEGSDTKEIIYNIMVEANGNIEKLKTLLDSWYNETMDRVTGWYKRKIQLITFIIGLLIAFSLNVDTIAIAKKLTRESDTRLEMVKLATGYAKEANADTATTARVNTEVKQIIDDIRDQESIISISASSLDPRTSAFWLYVLGCLITAIALSLGAPFWFDVMNKIVKLRGSGVQEKTDKKEEISGSK